MDKTFWAPVSSPLLLVRWDLLIFAPNYSGRVVAGGACAANADCGASTPSCSSNHCCAQGTSWCSFTSSCQASCSTSGPSRRRRSQTVLAPTAERYVLEDGFCQDGLTACENNVSMTVSDFCIMCVYKTSIKWPHWFSALRYERS